MPITVLERLSAERTKGRVENNTVGRLKTAIESFSQSLQTTDPFRMELETILSNGDFRLTAIGIKDVRRPKRRIQYSLLELPDGRGVLFEYDAEAADKAYSYRKAAGIQYQHNIPYIIPLGMSPNPTQLATYEAEHTLRMTLTRRKSTRLEERDFPIDTKALEVIRDTADKRSYTNIVRAVDASGRTLLPVSDTSVATALGEITDSLATLNNERQAYLSQEAEALRSQIHAELDFTQDPNTFVGQFYTFLQNHPGIAASVAFRALFETYTIFPLVIISPQQARVIRHLSNPNAQLNDVATAMGITTWEVEHLRNEGEMKLRYMLYNIGN